MAELKLDIEYLVNSTFGEHFGVMFDRLRELAEADKDGRCVVLPCKVDNEKLDEILKFCSNNG